MNNYNHYNRKPGRPSIFSYVMVALIAGIIGGLIALYVGPKYLYGNLMPYEENFPNDTTSTVTINTSDDINVVTAVASKTVSSVVGITTLQEGNSFFNTPVEGLGSGVVVDSNGYILTNSHVIGDGNADQINVLFEDGNQLSGNLLWNDSLIDLAVVKVDETELDIAELGNSDLLQVGEPAIAIGNPLGLEFQRTVTSGVISGLHRSIRISPVSVMEDLIQTDASINNGNSGGPLLNSQGQVIGINTAKVQGGEGLGFAIPINVVKPIIENVINDGQYSSVYIGFTGMDLEMYERQYGMSLDAESGVAIEDIIPNSPAANAGLETQDVILEMDDEPIESMSTLRRLLLGYNIGDRAILLVNRNGEVSEFEIIFVDF